MATINIGSTFFAFTISSGSANQNAVYSDSASTQYTVHKTVSGVTRIVATNSSSISPATSSGTLTKVSGTGDATLTYSAWSKEIPINYIQYAAADTLVSYQSSTLLIDETNTVAPGNVTANNSTPGTIKIVNTSTTTPIVVTLNTQNADFLISFLTNYLIISGDWINIGTGTGATGQTLDFNTCVGGVSIDYPPVVWVETGDNRHKYISDAPGGGGYFMPFFNCGLGTGTNVTPNYDVQNIKIKDEFGGDLDHGPVFQYDVSTKIATFGNGGNASKALGGTGWVSATHSGTTATINVGSGHGVVAGDTITVSGVTGTGAAGYNGTWIVSSVTATTIVFTSTVSTSTAAIGGQIDIPAGGSVIPNGARILYTNIHITSTVYDPSAGSRNQITVNSGGRLNFNKVSFSRNWNMGSSFYVGDSSITNTAIVERFNLNNNFGTLTIDNFAVAPDQSLNTATTTRIQFGTSVGDLYLDYIWSLGKATATYHPQIQVNNTTQLKGFGTAWSWISTNTVTGFPVIFDSVINPEEIPIQVGPFYTLGGPMTMYRVNNFHIKEIQTSDRVSRGVSALSQNAFLSNYANNLTVAKMRKLTNGSAPRNYLATADQASIQYAFKDIVYDCGSNTSIPVNVTGESGYAANVSVTNMRSSVASGSNAKKKTRYSNIVGDAALTTSSLPSGGFLEWATASTSSFTGSMVYDGEPVNCYWSAPDKSAGFITVGPFSSDKNMDHLNIVSGTENVDWYITSNVLACPGNGVELIFTNAYPIRGVLNFSVGGGAYTRAATSFASGTGGIEEFSLRINDGTDYSEWSSWYDASIYSNWQTALDSLSGYSSTNGFYIKFRIRTTAGLAARIWYYARISVTPDSSWTPPEIGYVPITLTGQIDGSTVKLYDNTTPASPIGIRTQYLTDASTILDFPYDFDANPKDFLVRLRKSGYGELALDGYTYQRGKPVPVSQIQYVVVDDSVASVLTGISVDTSTNTVTISESHTIYEIYSYLQWWATQIYMMEFDIPLITYDSITYTSNYNFVVDTGVTISGSGALTLTGGATLTMSGTAQSDIDISHTSGTKAWTRISVGGLISGAQYRIYNDTDAVEIANASASGTSIEVQKEWTGDKNISITAIYVNGLTAKLPFSSIGVFGETGASFTIDFEDDLVYIGNGIDGSTVTEFSPDYPSIQVDISDGDGTTTVQRLYAWFRYTVNSANGMRYFFNGIVADDQFNYRINPSIVDLLLDNQNTSPVILTGARLYRTDGSTIIYSSSNSIQVDPDKAYIARSETLETGLGVINNNVMKASKLIPATETL